MDPHYFWKLDPDPRWRDKLKVDKIAYSKQKEVPKATDQMSRIRIRHGSGLFLEAGSGSALEG
jgi:hypothetical protein